jgi:hypothetical protein
MSIRSPLCCWCDDTDEDEDEDVEATDTSAGFPFLPSACSPYLPLPVTLLALVPFLAPAFVIAGTGDEVSFVSSRDAGGRAGMSRVPSFRLLCKQAGSTSLATALQLYLPTTDQLV